MRKKEQDGYVIKPCAELTWQDVNGDLVAIMWFQNTTFLMM